MSATFDTDSNDIFTEADLHVLALLVLSVEQAPLQKEPLILATDLFVGAVSGFTDDLAQTVLLDRLSLGEVIRFWESVENETGREVPLGFQMAIDTERLVGGEMWNLRIAHAAGKCWNADEMESMLDGVIDQEMIAHPYSQGKMKWTRQGSLRRKMPPHLEEGWEKIFHTPFFRVLIRSDGSDAMLIAAESFEVEGSFEFLFRWKNGRTSTHHKRLTTGCVVRFEVEDSSGVMPIQITIRRERGGSLKLICRAHHNSWCSCAAEEQLSSQRRTAPLSFKEATCSVTPYRSFLTQVCDLQPYDSASVA